MHKYPTDDKVSFINIFKQQQESIIQDLLVTGGNNVYTIEGYDFILLEKNIIERLSKAVKKSTKEKQ